MKNKPFIAIAIAITIAITATAQQLKIGDKLLDITLTNTYNFSSPVLELSQLKKKLVILDFWGTRCTSCIKSFPKVDSMQKRFDADIQFIMVSKESAEVVHRLFTQKTKIKKPAVPFLTGDKTLHRLFPHDYVPHHVWLKDGKTVVAVTDFWNATPENIAYFLKHGKILLKTSGKYEPAIDLSKPHLMPLHDSTRKQYAYYSYLMPAIDSLRVTSTWEKTNGSKLHNHILMNKVTALGLYLDAFNSGTTRFQPYIGNVILNVRDSLKYTRPANTTLWDEWERKNLYFYDLLVPSASAADLFAIMQQDLKRIFGLKPSIEKRELSCYVLTVTDPQKLITKGGSYFVSLSKEPYDSLWILKNVPFSKLVMALKAAVYSSGGFFKDSSSFTGNVDIEINGRFEKPFNIQMLQDELKKYGLSIVHQTCIDDVLVITD